MKIIKGKDDGISENDESNILLPFLTRESHEVETKNKRHDVEAKDERA